MKKLTKTLGALLCVNAIGLCGTSYAIPTCTIDNSARNCTITFSQTGGGPATVGIIFSGMPIDIGSKAVQCNFNNSHVVVNNVARTLGEFTSARTSSGNDGQFTAYMPASRTKSAYGEVDLNVTAGFEGGYHMVIGACHNLPPLPHK